MNEFDLVKAMKKAGLEASEASKPVTVEVGKVVSASPIKIQVGQKITLGSAQLVLTRNVTDYKVKITMNSQNVYHTTHDTPLPTWIDKQEITVHNALKTGEKVILVRQKGGQKYVVIDRVS